MGTVLTYTLLALRRKLSLPLRPPAPNSASIEHQASRIEHRATSHEPRATNYPFFGLRALSRFASRDFFRAAVFLCIVLVEAVLSNFLTTSLYCSLAASASPLLIAVSKCLICVFIWLLRARLVVLLLIFCFALFFACNDCATLIS